MVMGKASFISIMLALMAAAGCGGEVRDPKLGLPVFKNEAARQIFYKSYDKAMTLWTAPYRDLYVETPTGRTHIVESGPANGRPVFFFSGMAGDATMFFSNASAVSKDYCCYFLDIPCFPGKSYLYRKMESEKDFTEWFDALLESMHIGKTAVVGFSYGGWLAAAMSKHLTNHVEATILIDPAETIQHINGDFYSRTIDAFVWFPSDQKQFDFFNWMAQGYLAPKEWGYHMLEVGKVGGEQLYCYSRYFQDEELKALRQPVSVILGGKVVIYDAKTVVERSKLIPDCETHIVPDCAHSILFEKADEVNALMVDFLKRKYPPEI